MKKQGHEDEARTVLRVCAERRIPGLAKLAQRQVEDDPRPFCLFFGVAWIIAAGMAYLSGWIGSVDTWLWCVGALVPALAASFFFRAHPKAAGKCEWARVRASQFLYKWLVGHGYARWRAVGWFAALVLVGFVMFHDKPSPRPGGVMQPTQSVALKAWYEESPEPWIKSLPKYNPLIYSADTLIPLVSFHQEDHWTPSGRGKWGWFVKNVYLPLHISAGWVIATLFVASFTRLMRQEG